MPRWDAIEATPASGWNQDGMPCRTHGLKDPRIDVIPGYTFLIEHYGDVKTLTGASRLIVTTRRLGHVLQSVGAVSSDLVFVEGTL